MLLTTCAKTSEAPSASAAFIAGLANSLQQISNTTMPTIVINKKHFIVAGEQQQNFQVFLFLFCLTPPRTHTKYTTKRQTVSLDVAKVNKLNDIATLNVVISVSFIYL